MSLVSSARSVQGGDFHGKELAHSKTLEEFVANVWKVFHVHLEINLQSPLPKKISSILRHFDKEGEQPQFIQEIIAKLNNIAKLEKRRTITPEDRAQAFAYANDLLKWMIIESAFVAQEAIGRRIGLPTPLWKNFRSMDEAVEEAGKIEGWLSTHQKTLDELVILFLDYSGLAILPDWIGLLRSLRVLKLSQNHLYFLPDSIGELSSLEKLIVHSNRLVCLPEALSKLTLLQVLALSENRLTDVPENIHQLASLTELNLSSNLFKAFPKTVVKMTRLEHLLLKGNQLTKLPTEIGNMTGLKELNVEDNKLAAVPATLASLSSMNLLLLNGNCFSSLPSALAMLPSSCLVCATNQNFSLHTAEALQDEISRVKSEDPSLGPQFRVMLKAGKNAQSLQGILAFWMSQFVAYFPEEQIENWSEDEFTRPLFSQGFDKDLREEQQLDRLTTFLHGLKYTKDYQKNKKRFIGIVGRLIGRACNGGSKELFDALQTSRFDSGDQIAAALNLIEVLMHYRSLKFRLPSEVKMAQLLIGLRRLKMLNAIIQKQIETNDHPIEAFLFYHILLKDTLKLPLPTEEMLNPRLAGISEELVSSACDLVLSQTSSQEQIKKVLLASNSWERAVQLIESEKLIAIIQSTKMEDGLILKLTEAWMEDHFAELRSTLKID